MNAEQRPLCGKTCSECCLMKGMPLAASCPPWLAGIARPNQDPGPRWEKVRNFGDGLESVSTMYQSGPLRVGLLDPSEQSRGGFLMPNISDWPNDASVSSLSDVLSTAPIPEKYFLSPEACAGILRRAAKRRRTLPAPLKEALVAVAAQARPRQASAQHCEATAQADIAPLEQM